MNSNSLYNCIGYSLYDNMLHLVNDEMIEKTDHWWQDLWMEFNFDEIELMCYIFNNEMYDE